MNKPLRKRSVVVTKVNKKEGFIIFWADWVNENAFADYGKLSIHGRSAKAVQKQLLVDPGYDFDEVLAYIENYGNEKPEPFYIAPIIPSKR